MRTRPSLSLKVFRDPPKPISGRCPPPLGRAARSQASCFASPQVFLYGVRPFFHTPHLFLKGSRSPGTEVPFPWIFSRLSPPQQRSGWFRVQVSGCPESQPLVPFRLQSLLILPPAGHQLASPRERPLLWHLWEQTFCGPAQQRAPYASFPPLFSICHAGYDPWFQAPFSTSISVPGPGYMFSLPAPLFLPDKGFLFHIQRTL